MHVRPARPPFAAGARSPHVGTVAPSRTPSPVHRAGRGGRARKPTAPTGPERTQATRVGRQGAGRPCPR
eukprot:9455850-Alexandrium_andersonii.AAC.1